MAKITLTSPVSQPTLDKVDLLEIQIRRHQGNMSAEVVYAEGYVANGKFESKNAKREMIRPEDFAPIMQAMANGQKSIEDNLINAILQWLIDQGKVAGTVA